MPDGNILSYPLKEVARGATIDIIYARRLDKSLPILPNGWYQPACRLAPIGSSDHYCVVLPSKTHNRNTAGRRCIQIVRSPNSNGKKSLSRCIKKI